MTDQEDERIAQRKHDLAQARGEAFANGLRQGREEAAAEIERLTEELQDCQSRAILVNHDNAMMRAALQAIVDSGHYYAADCRAMAVRALDNGPEQIAGD